MIGKRHEYDAMAKCEQQLWWYRCLHELTIQQIEAGAVMANPTILDAGCGTGELLLQLKKNGYSSLAGFDFSPDAVSYAREKSGLNIQQLDITSFSRAYAPNSFDIITSHDIICFLSDDQEKKAFTELLSVLKPGGLLLMNLPALKAFYGTHDVALGMQRRYSKKMINALIKDMAVVKKFIYWPFLLSTPIFLVRTAQRILLPFKDKKNIVSDVKMPSKILNRLFYTATRLENGYLKSKPWGSSLFVVLQKPLR